MENIPEYLKVEGTVVTGVEKESKGTLERIVIPEGMTAIGEYAFMGCDKLKEIAIPRSVKNIAEGAFGWCTSLETVRYGGTLAQWCALDNDAHFVKKAKHIFLGDGTDIKALKEIVIPEGVTKIGCGAFYGFLPLERVVLPESLNSLPSNVFSNKSALKAKFGGTKEQWLALGNDDFTSVECKDGTVGIEDVPPYFVMEGSRITKFKEGTPSKLVIPEGATCFSSIQLKEYIEDASEKPDAPKEKPCSITDITIPASVRYIGRCSCFNELKTVRYGGTLAQWCDLCRHASHIGRAEHIFLGNGTDIKALEEIVIPEGVRQINDGAFNGFTKLSSITIPPSVIKIGSAFGGCTNLTSVIIPCRVVKINALAFRGCAALTSVSIPSSVRKISWKAFDECPKLKDVRYGDTKEQWRKLKKLVSFKSGVTIHCSDGDIVTQ